MKSVTETLTGARKQLTRTVTHLAERHEAFKNIPTGRPMLGLIVTAEPFYTGAAYLLDHDVAVIPGGRLDDVPVATASAREVESLVTHGNDVGKLLLAEIEKGARGAVSLLDIGRRTGAENQILMEAWNEYPWPTGKAHAVKEPAASQPNGRTSQVDSYS